MRKSIIGKTYIPFDNSWSVNLTSTCDYPHKSKNRYLAGTNNTESKTCIIASEPFMCNTIIVALDQKHSYEMIIVECENESHMVLFDKQCVK